MQIIIDERETFLYDCCVSILTNEKLTEKIAIIKQVLPIGDIIIRNTEGKDIVIIERKSLQDLLASIKDGRYKEQSHRLIHTSNLPAHNIVYLVEGVLSQLNSQQKKIVFSTMTSLNIFKGFSVFRTSSMNETAEFIVSMADKIQRDLQKGKIVQTPFLQNETNCFINSGEPAPENYCNVVKKVKKENITPENIGHIILTQLPGISSVNAVAIMKPFSSFSEFLQKIKEEPEYLENIVLENNGKKRKINKSNAENIKRFLLGTS